jgi:hypothetical protein
LETSVLAVTAAGILALDQTSIWEPYRQTYLGREYFRVEQGSGSCGSREIPTAVASGHTR